MHAPWHLPSSNRRGGATHCELAHTPGWSACGMAHGRWKTGDSVANMKRQKALPGAAMMKNEKLGRLCNAEKDYAVSCQACQQKEHAHRQKWGPALLVFAAFANCRLRWWWRGQPLKQEPLGARLPFEQHPLKLEMKVPHVLSGLKERLHPLELEADTSDYPDA